MIFATYKELEKRVGLVTTDSQNKNNRIRYFVERRITSFTKTDVWKASPDISEATINRVLRKLRDQSILLQLV